MKQDTKLKQVTLLKKEDSKKHEIVTWVESKKAKVGNTLEAQDVFSKEKLQGRWEIILVNENSETEYSNIANINSEDIWKTQPINRGNK